MIQHRSRFGRVAASLVATVLAAAYFVVTSSPASAAGVSASGSIVYDKGGNVWQSTPDGATTHQITTNGATPTPDGTGSTGYTVPSESADGLIVAVRNQDFGSYSKGVLWVMDRNGSVIRKFTPPQFDLLPQFAGCSGPDAQFPSGIVNATVSPDGQHVAYTATAIGNAPDCEAISEVGSWVVDIDGTHGQRLSADPYGTADVEIGRWVSDTRLLIDRFDFGSIQNFYLDLPAYTATAWMSPSDFIDQTYLQPDVANGVLVTDGYSETSSAPTIRIWPTSGYASVPSTYCEFPSLAHPGMLHDNLNQPSLSPDGAYVVYEDYDGTTPDEADEGLYLAPAAATLTSTTACASANASLFVQGAADPFWTPASITQLPPDITAPTAALTAPTSVATVGSSTRVSWSGHDTGSGIAYYRLRYERAAYSGGFGAWAYPTSWQHLTATALSTGLSAGYDYCYSVRAYDKAGNASAWSAARCTAAPLDDRALSRSSGWRQVTGSGYYAHTATTTKTLHAALTRAGASLDRVGVLVTTCRGCGTVNVFVGTHLIGTVSLGASSTHYRVLRLLPRFSTRSGTVTLRVTSTNKTVTIDGLLISRS